jgi:uncharacterized protein (DUF433 family)
MPNLNRITLDPEICHGKPCIRNMRWPVEAVRDLIASGMGLYEILADHPELEREDLLVVQSENPDTVSQVIAASCGTR